MGLPLKISPNPLVTSTIELRFVSNLADGESVSKLVSFFLKDFPDLKPGPIPKDFKKTNIQLKYSPDHILSNETWSVSVSDGSIFFENLIEYPLWSVFFPFVIGHIESLFSLAVIKKIERIGVRYASVLDGVLDASLALNTLPGFSVDGYKEDFVWFRGDYKIAGNDPAYNLHLQIAKNAQASKNGVNKNGLYIDVDASYTNYAFADLSSTQVSKIIDDLHTGEKEFFFGLLKPEFIDTLNPTY